MTKYLLSLLNSWVKTVRRSSELEIYTDGGSKDAVGSWAYVVSRNGKLIAEKSGKLRRGSSNVMEFQAAIEALKSVPQNSMITLFSDSRILIDAMTAGEGPRAFQNQIATLLSLSRKCNVRWQWIKAHNGNKLNERCDELCISARST